MKVGDLVRRRVDYGIDKGVGLIIGSQPGNTTTTGRSTTLFKVKFFDGDGFPFYEAGDLEVISESG